MIHPDRTSMLQPTPAAYLKAARDIAGSGHPELHPVRVAVLSTFTAQVLAPYLSVEASRRGLKLQTWFAPWGQMEEQILNAKSELYTENPDVIVVLARIEELSPDLLARANLLQQQARQAEEIEKRIEAVIRSLRERTKAVVLVANFAPPLFPVAGVGDAMAPDSQTLLVQQLNATVANLCRNFPGCYVLDYARFALEHGLRAWTDAKLFSMARIPMSVSGQIALGRGVARTMRAALLPPAKVLVLDLDNTLWGGVLGEDGIGGIALGDEYPGNVYKAFQRYLTTLKERGFLLAVATKNNPADVEELWAKHRDCLLRREDFAAIRVNWQEKSTNLVEIAKELNVGLGSLVFFDDSPFEREEVRRRLPEVTVIEVPESALEFIETVEESGLFDRLSASAEDRQRAVYYREQAARSEVEQAASSPEEFLRSLQLVATIGEVGSETLPRVAQLLAKTNQFNLTMRRHGAPEIAAMIEQGGIALWLRLADRFGDNGLVGVAIAIPEGDSRWRLDSFLLSCRVIGRRAEEALLANLAGRITARGGSVLAGEYLPGPKNTQVADLYLRNGFDAVGEGLWIRDVAAHPIQSPDCIQVISL